MPNSRIIDVAFGDKLRIDTQDSTLGVLELSAAEVVDLARQHQGLVRALDWSLERLRTFVVFTNHGEFVRGSTVELVGFESKFKEARAALQAAKQGATSHV